MVRAEPDRAALEIAHRRLRVTVSLEAMLQHPTFQIILRAVARRHMERRAQVDVKKLQANDNDDF